MVSESASKFRETSKLNQMPAQPKRGHPTGQALACVQRPCVGSGSSALERLEDAELEKHRVQFHSSDAGARKFEMSRSMKPPAPQAAGCR